MDVFKRVCVKDIIDVIVGDGMGLCSGLRMS